MYLLYGGHSQVIITAVYGGCTMCQMRVVGRVPQGFQLGQSKVARRRWLQGLSCRSVCSLSAEAQERCGDDCSVDWNCVDF